MGLLFTKPAAPIAVHRSRPETKEALELEVKALLAREKLEADNAERSSLKTKRQECEAQLAILALPASNHPDLPARGIADYTKLLDRVRSFGMEDAWLSNFIATYNGKPEAFSQACHDNITRNLAELEAASRKVNAEKKREAKARAIKNLWEWPGPLAPIGMKAVPTTEGRYSHCTTKEEVYQIEGFRHEIEVVATKKLIEEWAAKFPLNPEEIATAWTVIEKKTNWKGSEPTRTKYCMWQARLALIAKNKLGSKTKENALTQEAPPAAPAKRLGLFAPKAESTTPTTDQPASETAPPQTVLDKTTGEVTEIKAGYTVPEDMWNEIAAKLGIKPDFEVKTKEDADWVLELRNTEALKLAWLTNRFNEKKKEIENAFTGIDERFSDRLQAWAEKNCDKGKKSATLLHGTLAFQSEQQSFSLNEKDEPALMGWIHAQDDETKKKIGAKPVIKYTRDLKAVYVIAAKAMADGKPIPGLNHRPANANAFYIRPSFDTVKAHIKEGKIK